MSSILCLLLVGCGGGGDSAAPAPGPAAPPPDTTPVAFTFAAQKDATPSAQVASAPIVISGIDAAAPVSVTGGEYSIDNGAYTSAAGTVANNQTVRVRATAASQFSTSQTVVLTIGGVSASFVVTTADPDTTPEAYRFPYALDAKRGEIVASAPVAITGINTATPITIENGEYSIAGGAFTSAAGTLKPGQTLTVRTTASANWSRITRARVTVGTVVSDFEVTSELPPYTPAAIAYDGGDVVFLLSGPHKLVFRWSLSGERYLDAYTVGLNGAAPTLMSYSQAQKRLYVAYESGAIRKLDASTPTPTETAFASVPLAVRGLLAAGAFVLAQDGSGAWATHYVFDGAGALKDQREWNYVSREYAWDEGSARAYFFRDNMSPNDLHYEVIDQGTGKITSAGETPYHGDYTIQPPIRVSRDGQTVLLGSGDLYKQTALAWAGSIGVQVVDARWFADGMLATLTTAGAQTTLRRLSLDRKVLERRAFAGTGLRVVGTDSRMAVVLLDGSTVKIVTYVPSDDSDGDGTANPQDAFPLDAAASLDSDHDGYPDAWNGGKSQADSTTGLALDAYPQDAACYLPAHGDGTQCDFGSTMPAFVPDQVVEGGDVVYLLSSANQRVFRWSMSTGRWLNPYVAGINEGWESLSPKRIAWSAAHNRLYVGYDSGALRYFDAAVTNAAAVPFANTAMAVRGLIAVGNYVLAQDGSGAWATHYVFDVAGANTDRKDWNRYSREYAWDPVSARVYFFRDDTSPNDLHFEVIDQGNGKITDAGETPYHGAYAIVPPIRVSVSGQYVLLGSGDIYDRSDLKRSGGVGTQVTDARWMADGSIVTLTTTSNLTTLRRLGSDLTVLEQRTFAGQGLRLLGTDARMTLVTSGASGLVFHTYVPSSDSDGDGVPNTQDAFPLDRAASVDTDHDGRPDAWNLGRSQSDSTTGLTLDAYPNDSACYLPAHGDGVHCDYGATIPAYVPDQVVDDGDVVYLLSNANRRVYRWSIATAKYLNPYVVGIDNGYGTIAPKQMAFSPANHRLYLGYETGAIRYVDTAASNGAEIPFATTATAVGGLGAAGNFLVAQDESGAWGTHSVFDGNGGIADQKDWNYYSRVYAWDPVSSRLYFFRDNASPNDLHFEVIDQTTGKITSAGETPYHGDYSIAAPIRVAPDGQLVLLGSGDLYNRSGLTWAGTLGRALKDARWRADALVDLDTTDRVEIRDPTTRGVLASYQYAGQPLALAFGTHEAYLVHVSAGTTAFVRLPFYDQDADGMPRWWEQLYGLSDGNAGDAAGDPDGDGVTNAVEYQKHSRPDVADTDADGLTDDVEIATTMTSPFKEDTDGDDLGDGVEVNTHHSNPLLADTDGDGYRDGDEVLYGGDPNDPSGLPQPLLNYSQTFEGGTLPDAWRTPTGLGPAWRLDGTRSHGGATSLMSGAVGPSQASGVRFRGFFTTGQLTFHAFIDNPTCCARFVVLVDGVQSTSWYGGTSQWQPFTVALTTGFHDVEWRFSRDQYSSGGTATAWIDDVAFAGH